MPERWPNQVRALDGALNAMQRGVKRMCITSPTGSGKTTVMIDLINWAVANGKSVALYTKRRMLYSQTCAVLENAGIRYGQRASGYDPNLFLDVQVCMTPTELSQVYKGQSRGLHDADLVIVDELHQHQGPTDHRIIDDHVAAGATLIGFTATPTDITGIDELLVAGWMSECLKIGALVKPETYAPDEPDLKHIKKYVIGDDLSESDNVKAIMRPGVFGRVYDAWRKHNPEQKPTLLFGPDVAGSLWFCQQFMAKGVSAAHIDSEQIVINGVSMTADDDNRKLLADKSRSGEVKVVCNRFVMREGIDWPWLECGCFATVFGALKSFLQSGGRLLRACPEVGKTHALILDHGGNWHRHGSLAADRQWELGMTDRRCAAERQQKIRERKEPEPITCPECGKVRGGGATCPACGFTAHRRSRLVVQVDGTLKPVHGDIYKPRKEKKEPDTQDKWNSAYYRARNSKRGMTFRQTIGLFFHEHHYWPPKTLHLMPRDDSDFFRKVSEVPREQLI